MNSETGELYSFDSDKAKAIKETELQQKLIELTREQHEYLSHFPAHDRNAIHKGLLSKNHAAKRRARKKIAKASRQRNRK